MSFFRYPGGKSKLQKQLLPLLESTDTTLEYREPFFGGGSVGLAFLKANPSWSHVWINDFDPGIACLWEAVIQKPEELKQKVRDFVPTVAAFDEMKRLLTAPKRIFDMVEWGFMKLAIHQISYSGLGTMSGGPLGGREQKSAYPIDCRWSPEHICRKIDTHHKQLGAHTLRLDGCTNVDFEVLIRHSDPAVLYLDPPYYEKGNELYQFGFAEADHLRLAAALRNCGHHWVLSYDDCEFVRDMYSSWAVIQSVDVNYTINSSRNKPELFIMPKEK